VSSWNNLKHRRNGERKGIFNWITFSVFDKTADMLQSPLPPQEADAHSFFLYFLTSYHQSSWRNQLLTWKQLQSEWVVLWQPTSISESYAFLKSMSTACALSHCNVIFFSPRTESHFHFVWWRYEIPVRYELNLAFIL
jgi:hypothetical protein